jgi:lysozyme
MNQMTISEQGLALIRKFEGFSATPYICPAGRKTIGYGHVIREGENMPDSGISLEEGEILLKQDVNIYQAAINNLVEIPISSNQFDALVSLVYNIGVYAFETSGLLRYLNFGDFEKTTTEFNRWIYVKKQKNKGLIARRAEESQLFSKKSGF